MPHLYIIAGCNGAGKTTASYTVLPEMLGCREFVNADEIARGLSPLNPGSVAIEAGRLMSSAWTTCCRKEPTSHLKPRWPPVLTYDSSNRPMPKGYFVTLLYFWLPTPQQAVERVATRVREGGHDIPREVICRRYRMGLKNLTALYAPICDYWAIYDNSSADTQVKMIASGGLSATLTVEDTLSYKSIVTYE